MLCPRQINRAIFAVDTLAEEDMREIRKFKTNYFGGPYSTYAQNIWFDSQIILLHYFLNGNHPPYRVCITHYYMNDDNRNGVAKNRAIMGYIFQ